MLSERSRARPRPASAGRRTRAHCRPGRRERGGPRRPAASRNLRNRHCRRECTTGRLRVARDVGDRENRSGRAPRTASRALPSRRRPHSARFRLRERRLHGRRALPKPTTSASGVRPSSRGRAAGTRRPRRAAPARRSASRPRAAPARAPRHLRRAPTSARPRASRSSAEADRLQPAAGPAERDVRAGEAEEDRQVARVDVRDDVREVRWVHEARPVGGRRLLELEQRVDVPPARADDDGAADGIRPRAGGDSRAQRRRPRTQVGLLARATGAPASARARRGRSPRSTRAAPPADAGDGAERVLPDPARGDRAPAEDGDGLRSRRRAGEHDRGVVPAERVRVAQDDVDGAATRLVGHDVPVAVGIDDGGSSRWGASLRSGAPAPRRPPRTRSTRRARAP